MRKFALHRLAGSAFALVEKLEGGDIFRRGDVGPTRIEPLDLVVVRLVLGFTEVLNQVSHILIRGHAVHWFLQIHGRCHVPDSTQRQTISSMLA